VGTVVPLLKGQCAVLEGSKEFVVGHEASSDSSSFVRN
jgi:hypothetical protein